MHKHLNSTNRFIRLPEVLTITGLKRSTLYNQLNAGLFPKPKRLGSSRCVAWSLSEIQNWIDAQPSVATVAEEDLV